MLFSCQAPRKSQKSTSPTTDKNKPSTNKINLCFIVGGTPDELKSKEHMTMVRKKAMDYHLNDGKKRDRNSTTSGDRSRKPSEAVSERSSVGSEEPPTKTPALPTTQQTNEQTNQSALIRFSAPSRHDRRRLSPVTTVERVPSSMSSVLPPSPIVLPMRPGDLPYDMHPPPELKSLGKSLDPFQTMYQSNHPLISVEDLKHHCSRYFGTRGLGLHWIPTCLEHPHTFLSTLCLASAHHDIIGGKPSESLATKFLRQEIIHFISENLCNSEASIADHNIVAVTQLIIGEVIGREEMSLSYHEAGIVKMIEQRGGLNQLGMGGHLASAISWVSLASAVFREVRPRSMYTDYSASHSSKKYPPHFTIPESPIFRPNNTFGTLQRSNKCGDRALNIIQDIWMMIDLFLHETKQSRRNSQSLLNVYKTICEYTPVSVIRAQGNVLTERDWRYEAIRIAAIIQATAIIRRVSLSEALELSAPVAPPQKPTPLYTNSIASRSSDSVVSPFDPRHDTPVTEYSTSPYSMYSTSPAIAQNGFPFSAPRASFSSNHSTSNAQRPSLTSLYSDSSNTFYFPPPAAPAPSGPTSQLRALRDALENSNLSESWSEMGGVLLWIGLVVGAASRKSDSKVLKRYFSATAMRAAIILCFDHPEAIHSTMMKMTAVVEALGDCSKGGEVVRKEKEGTAGKKRRT